MEPADIGRNYSHERNLLSLDIKTSLVRLEEICLANTNKFKEKLFQKHLARSVHLDPKRKQLSLSAMKNALRHEDDKKEFDGIVPAIHEVLKKRICEDGQKMVLSAGNILYSLPNGEVQAWHHDFPVLDYTAPPRVFIIPVSKTCRMDVCKYLLENPKENEVMRNYSLKRGEVFSFHGYLPHRGCSYAKDNFRIHFYCLHENDMQHLKTIESHTEIFTDYTPAKKKGRPRKDC